jgi:hypothetical protein
MNPKEKQKFLKESKKLLKATSKLLENKFSDASIEPGRKKIPDKFGFTRNPYSGFGEEISQIIKLMVAINNSKDLNKVVQANVEDPTVNTDIRAEAQKIRTEMVNKMAELNKEFNTSIKKLTEFIRSDDSATSIHHHISHGEFDQNKMDLKKMNKDKLEMQPPVGNKSYVPLIQ